MTGAGGLPLAAGFRRKCALAVDTHPECRARDSHPGSSYFTASCFSCPLTWNFPHPWPATAVRWFQPVGNVGRGLLRHRLATLSRVPRGHGPAYRSTAGMDSLFSSLYSVSTQPIPLGVIVTVSKFWDIPVPSARGEACTPLPARRAKIQSWIGISSSPLPAWVSRQLPCG